VGLRCNDGTELSEDGLHRFVSDRGRVLLADGQIASRGLEISVPKHLLNVGYRNTLFDHVPSQRMFEAVAPLLADSSEDGDLGE